MAEHRLRRWLQFGILDLLILTAVVAVVVFLFQPVKVKVTKAQPWLYGVWRVDFFELWLYPDGYYAVKSTYDGTDGVGWTIARTGRERDEFVLECGKQRFVIRSAWGTGVLEVLNEDGSIQSRLEQRLRFEGPMHDGRPHGTWSVVGRPGRDLWAPSWEYRNGEVIDLKGPDGKRDLVSLNARRTERGLSKLTERDFPKGKTP